MIEVNIGKKMDNIRELLPENSEEQRALTQCYKLLQMSMPTTLSESQIRVANLDAARVQLSNIIFMISQKITSEQKMYYQSYNKEFTKYTNLGRPNQTAVDSEVLSKNPQLLDTKYKIESYDNFRQLLNSYVRSIDQIKITCMETWKDNRFSS